MHHRHPTVAKIAVLFVLMMAVFGHTVHCQNTTDYSRGVGIIGNWGSMAGITEIPEDYFDYLKRLNTQWVVIGNSMHVDNSVDSTVELRYTNDFDTYVPSWPDATLRTMVNQLHNRGYKVILAVGFDEPWPEDGSQSPVLPGKAAWRYQLGQPTTPSGYTLAEWPWNPSNAINQRFVSSFWKTYTDVSIYHAKLCQDLGVEMFEVGAESQELFRTSNIGTRYTMNYKTQVKALVDSVRNHYSGKIAYYMHVGTWKAAVTSTPSDSTWHDLWGDANFDIIGVSMYDAVRPTTASYTATTTVNTVSYFKNLFKTFLTTYVKKVTERYPAKPVVALELGFQTRDITNIGLTEPKGVISADDFNKNGILDAEEVQGNLFQAYFDTADSLGYPKGGMIFGDAAESDAYAALGMNLNGWGIRNREAELRMMRRFKTLNFSSSSNRAPRLLTTTDSDYVAVIGESFASKKFAAWDDDITLGDTILYRTVWENYPWFGAATTQGRVVGIPADDDFGWWQVKLYVQDVYGKVSTDTAKFKLWVIHKRSSRVTSAAPTQMTPGIAVSYQIAVNDANGIPITPASLLYKLNVNPGFLSVSTSGKVTGMPTYQIAGTRSGAEVRIITPAGDTLYDSWTVMVANANIAPQWENNRAVTVPGTTQSGFILSPSVDALISADSLIQFKSVSAADMNATDTLTYSFRIYGNGLDTTLTANTYNREDSLKFGPKTTKCVLFSDIAKKLQRNLNYEWTVTASDGKATAMAPTPYGRFKVNSGSVTPTVTLLLSAKSIAFGNVRIGSTKSLTVTLTNTGNQSLVVSSITSNSAKFKVNVTQQTIAGAGNATDSVTYTPSIGGADNARIIITSNAPSSPDTITVTGYGAVYSATVSVKSIALGNIKIGTKKDTVITIRNIGNQQVAVSNVTVSSAVFTVSAKQFTVDTSKSMIDTISFTPVSTGSVTGKIVILSSASSSPDTVTITANGVLTGIRDDMGLPVTFSLSQNYPNPFNPSTTILYGVPERSSVKISVYTMLGQRVDEISHGSVEAGYYEYLFDGTHLPSGVYVYRIEAVSEQNVKNVYRNVKKMMLMK
jgi:hypothetical protein